MQSGEHNGRRIEAAVPTCTGLQGAERAQEKAPEIPSKAEDDRRSLALWDHDSK